MTDQELKKLNRQELLQILLDQSMEIERLRQQLAETQAILEERTLHYEKAGTLADAALRLNHIFEDADEAAKIYLDNIKRMEQECAIRCAAIEAETKKAMASRYTDHIEFSIKAGKHEYNPKTD